LKIIGGKGLSTLCELSVKDIMNPLVMTARGFIAEQTGISKKLLRALELHRVEKLVLRDVSSFIELNGVFKGKFVVSMDYQLIKELVKNFAIESMTEEEIEEYVEDTLAECSNIILGNSIKMFPNIEEYVTVESPLTISSQYAAFRYSEDGIWTCIIDCGLGSASVSFISSDVAV
jgi:two-component system chemotaxis sensor kinase CheA